MSDKMFCFQCEQTAHSKGCTIQGVCGKQPDTANLQDVLLDKIVEFASCISQSEENTNLILKALFTTVTNVNFDNESIQILIDEISSKISYDNKFDINSIWSANEDIRSLKSLILFGLKGMAAYTYHAKVLGYTNSKVDEFFYKALQKLSQNLSQDELLNLVLETGKINLYAMELLDKANTETYGTPVPTTVSTEIEAGPFIVVSGHDLRDLALLLEQTKDKNINIYTHGEMLPCHAYPELKKYPHLKGNFGTAWQNQQKEFIDIPAPVLFTTNCIMPVKDNYADRIFTTSVVEYPNVQHIGENKDFTPVIEKALELGGYKEPQKMTGINGGNSLTVGFGHSTIMSVADKLIESVKSGKINRIFLIGGCDGARPGRNYYTEFAENVPKDCIIMTLACGKYRFNKLEFGDIDGLPRLLDIGQCNDVYSAICIAVALADAFDTDVNGLPLSLIVSWYEQKAVADLLALLSLGIKNIYLGPTLPAFLSPNVLQYLSETFGLRPISNAEDDLKTCLKQNV